MSDKNDNSIASVLVIAIPGHTNHIGSECNQIAEPSIHSSTKMERRWYSISGHRLDRLFPTCGLRPKVWSPENFFGSLDFVRKTMAF